MNCSRNAKNTLMLFFFLVFHVSLILGQTPGLNKSVLISAETKIDPPEIILKWQPVEGSTSVKIFRKLKNGTAWGNSVSGNLAPGTTTWTDNNVETGTVYEYYVLSTGSVNSSGYIYSGIDLPEIFYRGTVILVYDTISTHGLDIEIDRWIIDVEGDGYDVKRIPVNQNDAITSVKSKILNVYNLDKQNTTALFLFGRVPVPYSGLIVPDGHSDHQGAWPADGYYAEFNGTWSDNLINNTSASSPRNHNIKGDGKFDQSTFPSDVDLQIGRVDMHDLPSFALGETELLRRYLDKNHAFRNKKINTNNIAIIDDEFTNYPEGFSASGWRSFSSLFGYENITKADYLLSLKEKNYLWSYGCGAGNYRICIGVIGSSDLVKDSLNGIFTMLFGSYFGDWDSPQDNLLRSALASGTTLTNCWSGRPYWYFHHMGLGESIGYSTKISMNNSGLYDFNNSQRGIHMALMGDPTLRAHIVAPPENFIAENTGGLANLSWTASFDTIIGYNIYRQIDSSHVYEKINDEFVSDTFFIDSCLVYPGIYKYMVRAVKMQKTNSGSYFNMSQGKTASFFNSNGAPIIADFAFVVDRPKVYFNNLSKNATNFIWDFGDGNTSSETNPSMSIPGEGHIKQY